MSQTKPNQGAVYKFLAIIERVGNALPHPATLFAIFALAIVLLSWVFSLFDISVIHPGTQKTITPFSLISIEGLHLMLTKMVVNFTAFAPLGTVLVALLGIGIAEGSGLIGTGLRLVVISSPPRLLTFVIVFAGVISNTASEVGYVLLVPLAAIIFLAAGRHPLAGLAAAFAGVSGGYSANLLLGTIDPLLAGLSEEAARIIDPTYIVNPAANYLFMAVSTFVVAFLGTWVTEKLIVPRLGKYEGEEKADAVGSLDSSEKRGLWWAFWASLIFIGLMIWSIMPLVFTNPFNDVELFRIDVPGSGFLRNPVNGSILKSPFMDSIVAFIFLGSAVAGIAYGIGAKTIKNDSDVMRGMSKSMETLGSYIVLVFFAAQFVAYFNWTNLGLITAVKGAEFLESTGWGPIPLMISFIIVSAIINLVMGSASAKWAIMAPVFIPMFMLLGYSPEFTQLAYRIGDSVTNIISPMMSYFALIVAFIQRYDKKAGIGTVVSLMLPYSVVFFIGWTILLIIWILFGWPIGPGAALDYQLVSP
jgi:aminobenzoyl-glutamate transport protein